jgi:hypothetical protein
MDARILITKTIAGISVGLRTHKEGKRNITIVWVITVDNPIALMFSMISAPIQFLR